MGVKCPYCLYELKVAPKRKKKCSGCGNFIYVRRGKLSTQDQLAGLPTRPPPLNEGTLEADIDRYADEFYNRGDLEAGKSLLLEIGGIVAVGGAVLTVLTSWLPPLGITLGSGTVAFIVIKATEFYADATAEQRKAIRAVVKWLQGGFQLDNLVDDQKGTSA